MFNNRSTLHFRLAVHKVRKQTQSTFINHNHNHNHQSSITSQSQSSSTSLSQLKQQTGVQHALCAATRSAWHAAMAAALNSLLNANYTGQTQPFLKTCKLLCSCCCCCFVKLMGNLAGARLYGTLTFLKTPIPITIATKVIIIFVFRITK
jgi:hypothetical protein